MIIDKYWNSVERKSWPTKARMHVRPSEIGSPMYDRYLSMSGVEPTNPFSENTLKIFDAGKMVEFLLTRTLRLTGILRSAQRWIEIPQTNDYLGLKGYLDVEIGGHVDWSAQQGAIYRYLDEKKLKIDDEIVEDKALKIIRGLQQQYPDGVVPPAVIEIKSTSMDTSSPFFTGMDNHKMQLYAYLVATGYSDGFIFYLEKSNFSLTQIHVHADDEEIKTKFFDDLIGITKIIRGETFPVPEPMYTILGNGMFASNWSVRSSRYLRHIYGLDNEDHYDAVWLPKIDIANRMLDDEIDPGSYPDIAKEFGIVK